MADQHAQQEAMVRDRARRLFLFLRELSQLRTRKIRTIDRYDEVLWLDGFPEDRRCAHLFRDDLDSSWVEVRKPDLPQPPLPPDDIAPWLEPEHVADSRLEQPALRQTITVNVGAEEDRHGQTLRLEDNAEVREQWRRWVEESWLPWARRDRRMRPVQDLYRRLFSLYQHYERSSEEYEIVLATGLFLWRPADGGEVRRHLITARGHVGFDPDTGTVSVQPHPERAEPSLEIDMLEPGERPDLAELERVEQSVSLLTEAFDDTQAIHRSLEMWAKCYPDALPYDAETGPVARASEHPLVQFAPAIILRSRGERDMTRIFSEISERLGDGAEVPEGVRVLVKDPDRDRPVGDDPADADAPALFRLYYPKEANHEQERVAREIEGAQGVVVHGPPGTGKSHTIANVVCHLLATGKRVLVTSHTQRALRVLREMFPADIQPLCVVALGADAASMEGMERAVNEITNKHVSWDDLKKRDEILWWEQELENTCAHEQVLLRDLRVIREQESGKITLQRGDYSGTLQSIADTLRRQEAAFGWIKTFGTASEPPPVSNEEASELLELLRSIDEEETAQLRGTLLKPQKAPSPADFEEMCRQESDADSAFEAFSTIVEHEDFAAVAQADSTTRGRLRAAIQNLVQARDTLLRDAPAWLQQAVDRCLRGQLGPLRRVSDTTEEHLQALTGLSGTATGVSVVGLEDRDRDEVIADASDLLAHIEDGGKLGFLVFRPRLVRDGIYLIRDVRVDGRPCEEPEPLRTLIDVLEAEKHCCELDELWANLKEGPTGALPVRIGVWEDTLARLQAALRLHDFVVECRNLLESVGGINAIDWHDPDDVELMLQHLHAAAALNTVSGVREQFDRLLRALSKLSTKPHAHSTIEPLRAAIAQRDPKQYRDVFSEMTRVDSRSTLLKRRDWLLGAFQKWLPALANCLEDTHAQEDWDDRLNQLWEAWEWSQADAEVHRLSRPDEEQRLASELEQAREKRFACLHALASLKAWQFCLSRLTSHERQHLRAWQKAIRNVGKGTGKYAPRHKKEAREHMQECQSAIPAWIMPLHRIAATVTMKPDIFDVAIIDEASQSGPEALFLHYIAKKIVVVGDEKQISPANVGVDLQDVENLIRQHISDIPLNKTLALANSYYDQAEIRYDRHIQLREHFRCMPEIIQFSNDLCYREQPLIPLKQYGQGRLKPVVGAIHVPDGYQEGNRSDVVNPPEARAIVDRIIECCDADDYEGKTFGVITLLGKAQEALIQSLLVEHLGPEEMDARRLQVGNAYDFQGDQRDVIFLSMVSAPGEAHRIGVLNRRADEQRFNVAASRAKEQMLLFHSVALDDLNPNGLRYRLLSYCRNPRVQPNTAAGINLEDLHSKARNPRLRAGTAPSPFDSWFEVDVFLRIVGRGYRVLPQFEVNGYRIDMVVEGMQGRLAVECDGDDYHSAPEDIERDIARQRDLERAGYPFWRVRGSVYYREPDTALRQLWETLEANGILPDSVGEEAEVKRSQEMMMDIEATESSQDRAECSVDRSSEVETDWSADMPTVDRPPPIGPQRVISSREASPESIPVIRSTSHSANEAVEDAVEVEDAVSAEDDTQTSAGERTFDVELGDDQERIAGRIGATPNSEWRFYVSQYKGAHLPQVRRWINTDDYTGYSRQGLSLLPSQITHLADVIAGADSCREPEEEVELGRLAGPSGEELVIRVLPGEDGKGACLDVRVFVNRGSYKGWSKKGFRILFARSPAVAENLVRLHEVYTSVT